jgi:hypothetical protein
VALAVLTVLLAAGIATAQSESTPPESLTALRLQWQTQLARQDAANWEAELVSAPPGAGLTVGNFQDPAAVLKELRPFLVKDYDALRTALIGLGAKAKTRREEIQKDWAEVVRQRAAFRQYADRQQANYGFDFEAGTPPGFRPTALDGVLLACAVVVAVVALRLRRKEMRLTLRKWERASQSRALATAGILLGLLTLSGCGGSPAGSDSRPWVVREEERLNVSLAEATAKADFEMRRADQKWQATAEGWAKLVTAPGTSGKEEVDQVVREGETNLRNKLREVAIDAKLAERLAKDAEQERATLAEEKAKLEGLIAGAKWRSAAISGVRIAFAVVLFALCIWPFWSARRARARAIRTAARTCPRCFRLGTLHVEQTDSDTRKTRYRRKKTDEDEEDEEEAEANEEDAEAKCSKCGLRIRKSYLTVPRLCFPTVGVRSSGKTHMLATAYDRVRKRSAPTTAAVQPARSTRDGEAERRFEQFIHLILIGRGEAGATDLSLPDPILLHLKDTDPSEPNSALVNLFDYSGELVNPDVDVNQLKSTAVKMDGFMLFLDPTQLYGDGANVTLDQQLGMLDEFLDHMRKERRIPVGEQINVPVAVCITKFDLLLTENPIGGQSVAYIRELLENMNPPPKQMTPEVLQQRSHLVEEMLPLLFPGANIRAIIEGYFGKQLLFFPMSAVSLFEHELGIRDLERRTMAPFGVAEPILWLLHMHGYQVFGDRG